MSVMEKIKIYFQRLEGSGDVKLPSYETSGASGMDLRAANFESIHLMPGKRVLIPTGFKMALPEGYEAQIRPRSGLAFKNGITMLNSPGTIDSDYRGEVKVLAINHGEDEFVINYGDRIAQMVIAPVYQISIQEISELPETVRGGGGFGSTGIS